MFKGLSVHTGCRLMADRCQPCSADHDQSGSSKSKNQPEKLSEADLHRLLKSQGVHFSSFPIDVFSYHTEQRCVFIMTFKLYQHCLVLLISHSEHTRSAYFINWKLSECYHTLKWIFLSLQHIDITFKTHTVIIKIQWTSFP
jgi:hypothetical protein